MNSRMDKYYSNEVTKNTRIKKNKDMYTKINDKDIENLSLTSNISIISSDTTNLDIEKIKKILSEKYSQNKKDEKNILIEDINDDIEDTKEYDLNKIIEAARLNKKSDYNKDRFEKNMNIQYDILNELNISKLNNDNRNETFTTDEEELMTLIKTVNDNSIKNSMDDTESDLMIDLKGDSETETLSPINIDEMELEEKISETNEVDEVDEKTSLNEKYEYRDITNEININTNEENTFYTGTYKIDDEDFEDFESLKKEVKSGNFILKLLIVLLMIVILFIIIYFLNKYLNLGLF